MDLFHGSMLDGTYLNIGKEELMPRGNVLPDIDASFERWMVMALISDSIPSFKLVHTYPESSSYFFIFLFCYTSVKFCQDLAERSTIYRE
jgi:hypothetical protein